MKKFFENTTARNIVFGLTAAALSFCSFFFYLYPPERNWTLIIILGFFDLVFSYLNAVFFLDDSDYKWLKAIGFTVGYFVVFNAAPAVYFLIADGLGRLSELWLDVLMYSLFSGPLMILVIILVSVVLIFIGWINGHTIN